VTRRSSPTKTVLVGLACGLAAVVLVRAGVALLLGGAKVLIVLTGIGVVWLLSRRSRARRDD
jgi:Flp pilus assembly protein TadB